MEGPRGLRDYNGMMGDSRNFGVILRGEHGGNY